MHIMYAYYCWAKSLLAFLFDIQTITILPLSTYSIVSPHILLFLLQAPFHI